MPPKQLPEDNPNEVILEGILEDQNRLGTESNDIAEKNLEQNAQNGEALETANDIMAEGFGKVLEEMKGPKEVRIIPPETDEQSLAAMFWQMLRGPKGEQGESIKGDKGDRGENLTFDMLTPEQKAEIKGEKGDKGDSIKGDKGRDGRDGKDAVVDYDLIQSKIKVPKDGKDGKNGKDGKDGKSPSFKDIWDKFREKIEKFIDKKHDDTLQATRSIIASKTYSYKELDDVFYPSTLVNGEPDQNAVMKYDRVTHKWVPGTDNNSGGSGGGFAHINEVVSGSGTSWALADTPDDDSRVALYGGGSRLTPGADYSISGAGITTVNPYDAGQLLADY